MKKRIIATLLSLCLVVGLLPVTAMAVGTVSVTTEAELLAAIEAATGTAENPAVITVKEDITLSKNIFVPSGKCIVLCGVDSETKITLADTAELTEGEKQTSMIEIGSKSSEDVTEVTLENITLDANSKARVLAAHGVNTLVTMNENTTITHGGGIVQGVGVCLVGSTFVMNGGLIVDNHTTSPSSGTGNSGTIVLYEQASFIMNDGAIKDNVVTRYCGGIYSWGGAKQVSIHGGEITGNEGGYGGGITLLDNLSAVFEITGGKICGNNCRGTGFSHNIFSQKTPVLVSGNAVVGDSTQGNSGIYFNSTGDANKIVVTGKLSDKAQIYTQNKTNYTIVGADDYQVTDSDAEKFIMTQTPTTKFYVDKANNQIKWAEGKIITFKVNDGSDVADYTQTVPSGVETALNANTFTRTGYTFSGWKAADSEATYADKGNVTLTSDLTLLAQWTPNEYAITYHLNGGTAVSAFPDTHTYDTATTLVEPTRTGYAFGGWYTNAKYGGDALTILAGDGYTADIDLFAKWTPNTYTIAFDANGGTGTTASVDATYDTPATLTANGFTKSGYLFAGWDTAPGADRAANEVVYSNGSQVLNLTSVQDDMVTLYAVWVQKESVPVPEVAPETKTYNGQDQGLELDGFTVTYRKNGDKAVPVNAGTYDLEITKAETDTEAAYHSFLYGALTITPAELTVTADNKTMLVNGTLPVFTCTASGLQGSDTVELPDPQATCAATGKTPGTFATVPRTVAAGNNYTITYVNGTLTVYARSSGGGSSSGGSSSGGSSSTKNPDGSTTTVETKKDGTVTETTKTPDGTTGTVVTDKDGAVTEVKASVSSTAAKEAEKTGGAVTLPVEVPSAKTTGDAPAVEVTMPRSTGSVKVEIPVEKVTPGTVAVIVQADGTEKIVSTSAVTENGVALSLSGSATVKVIDNSKSFTDVSATNVFYNEICSLSAREIMVGKTDEKFDLYSSVTLNQIANVAGRITGAVDVKDYNAGIAWGAENGLKTGNMDASRGDVLKALYVAAGSPTVADTGVLTRFNDASAIPADLTAAAAWAAQNGILKGDLNGNASLNANVTRGQACALAGRTMGTLA